MPGPSLVCLASHGGPEGMPRRTQEPCSLRPGHQPVFIPLLWGNRFYTPRLTEVKYRISNLPLFILGLLEKLNLQLIPISGYDAFQPSSNALHLNSVKPPSVSPQRETDSGRGSIDMERRWSSVQNPAQLQLHRPHHNNFNNGTSHSESDDSSLNSVEVEDHSNNGSQGPLGVGAPPPQGPYISGSVTTVPIEGVSPNSSASGQLRENRLRDELSKIKGDKLELLRQNMSAQRELKLLRERENQLQTDLSMASREIQRLHRNARSGQS